jgi:AraC-like DNA-binding protein
MGEPLVEQVRYRPGPALARFVASYTGYRLEGVPPGVHAGLPSTSLTFIVSFDAPLDIAAMPGGRQEPETFWAMVSGLHMLPATVRHDGRQHGVQIELTPVGSMALLGTRPGDLAATVVHLGDLDTRLARELVERLSAVRSWSRRFAELDAVLLRSVGPERRIRVAIPDPAADAWQLLHETDGTITVGGLADELGWSRRHLTEQFRRAYGIGPKECAQVIRFERARGLLGSARRPTLAAVAAECGYADQSHFTRDWKRFAGCTPSDWLADELPYLQDEPVEL